jgi:hypothetical protein
METSILRHGRLWIAVFATEFGAIELLCGEGDRPNLQHLILAERFLQDPNHLRATRNGCPSPRIGRRNRLCW